MPHPCHNVLPLQGNFMGSKDGKQSGDAHRHGVHRTRGDGLKPETRGVRGLVHPMRAVVHNPPWES